MILFHHFRDVIDHEDAYDAIAVDIPIGLPDRIEGTGRGPEQAVRPLLGKRRTSVFSIPSRAAVEVDDFLDACVCCVMAERSLSGELKPYPLDYKRDSKGLRMAIWA